MTDFVAANVFMSSSGSSRDELQRALVRALGERALGAESYESLRDAVDTAMSELQKLGYSASLFDENGESFVTYTLRAGSSVAFEASFYFDEDEGTSLSLTRLDAQVNKYMALGGRGVIVERDEPA